MNVEARVESLAIELRTRRASASGDDAARLQALERRLVAAAAAGTAAAGAVRSLCASG